MRLFFGLVSQVVLLLGAPAPPAFRLPDVARPTRYELELTIIPRQADFRGAIRIDVELKTSTPILWINSKDLTIEKARLISAGVAAAVRTTVVDEFVGLEFPSDQGPGAIRIEIEYRGQMSDKSNSGLYRKRSGAEWYAFTTFTPIEARKAFPCFDEPAYKAPWRVIAHVPRGDVAASNAPLLSERPEDNGLKRVEFAQTRPLPSELAAIVVGPFDIVSAGFAGRNRVPVRVLTPKGRAGEASAVREATAGIIERLEDYTGIPYPFDKLDHVAILDMPYGAVENPGVITYRDTALLARPERDTPERAFRRRATMAHELAHQWFGNLVTQAWWDDVWLSEGFATWLGGKITDQELPVFERGLAAVASRAQIMRADALPDTRPVRVPMNSRKDMESVYSRIVYQKSAAILRMVEDWIGPEAFQKGLRAYLREHSDFSATTSDLARALSQAGGVNVEPVLHSFLNRTGFPEIRAQCADGQIFFTASGPWTTPVCFQAGNGPESCSLTEAPPASLPKREVCPAWIWPNREGAGYYSVITDDASFERLMKNGWSRLSAPERLSIIENTGLAAESKIGGDALRAALPAMVSDEAPAVANAAYRLLLSLLAAASPGERPKFDETIKAITAPRRGRR